MELRRLTGECNGGLHAQAMRIGNLEAEFSRIALPVERESKQNDCYLRQPTQGLNSGTHIIPAERTVFGYRSRGKRLGASFVIFYKMQTFL